MTFSSVEEVERALESEAYLPGGGLATAVYLALAFRRPRLLGGRGRVGKTEVGKTLARLLGAELIRLQWYEGIDSAFAGGTPAQLRLLRAEPLPARRAELEPRDSLRAL